MLLKFVHKLTIIESVFADGVINTCDPKGTKISLLVAAVAVAVL